MTKQSNEERDPLLDDLDEAIAQGPIIFTPDDEFLRKLEERHNEQKD